LLGFLDWPGLLGFLGLLGWLGLLEGLFSIVNAMKRLFLQ
jgi:hypothetical protein